MSQALVDVVIPSYNRKKLLKRAVQSVQKQSYPHWKLFIADDGSTDGTSCAEYGNKVQFLKLKHGGVSYARNQGIKRGSAEWIAFLDSDDEWLPDKLEKQMEYARAHPQYSLIHCNEIWIKEGKILAQKKKHKKQGGNLFIPSVRLCCISPSATLVKRSLLEELGLFREDFPVCEDYEMWLRISSRYEVGFLKEELIIKYGGHSDQLSASYPAMDYWRVKALYPYLGDKSLSLEERNFVKQNLMERVKILIRGYKKYKNFKYQKEMESIFSELNSQI